ncbi:hypothetical protein KP509_21G012100 [Ceratopteris richardii]|uniref:Uncharacterized protein n=1 Tax=Ceratopteris richardii TaxID=49495 RepID=A0A8T2SAB5_CERRI|nr:hypothetical protein KP509_21G012100 [Ceratopteris richardii]
MQGGARTERKGEREMRGQGIVKDHVCMKEFSEKVKSHRTAIASKHSGRCGRARCQLCHRCPASKSMSKTKGRNKRSRPLDDDKWSVRPPSTCDRFSFLSLMWESDYDDYDSHPRWRIERVDTAWIAACGSSGMLSLSSAVSAGIHLDSHEGLSGPESITDAGERKDDCITSDLSNHDAVLSDAQILKLANHSSETFNRQNEDNKVATGVEKVVLHAEVETVANDKDRENIMSLAESDSHWHAVASDTDDDGNNISDEWYYVQPSEIIDDWYLC